MQDGGEELKRFGINLNNIQGQAIAGATETKKFEVTMKDLNQSLGDILKESLNPFIEMTRSVVQELTHLPPAFQALTIATVTLATVWGLLNSHFTTTYQILGVSLGIIYTLVTAIEHGQYIVAGLSAAILMLGAALLLMRNSLFAAALAQKEFTMAIQLAGLALKENPYLLIVTALAAAGTALYAFIENTKKNNEELEKTSQASESAANGLDKLQETLDDMATAQLQKELQGAREELKKAAGRIFQS